MIYVAQKPCSFAGIDFKIGEEVPEVLIAPGASKSLIGMGILAKKGTEIPVTVNQPITITIHADEGDMDLEITNDALQSVFDVLLSTAAEAEPIVTQMTEGDALILLDLVDNRKSIKAMAEERAKTLSAQPEDTEGEESEGEL